MSEHSYASAEIRPLYFALGAVAGLVAVAYNRVLLSTIAAVDRLSSWPVELRAGLIGAGVGTMAWFAPGLVGGGDTITQRALSGAGTLTVILAVFLLRFGLGALSYAARTPGGLFAPLLVLGAQLGLSFGIICRLAFPGSDIQPEGFAIVGMAALFTGIVRAPLTGLVLVTEMTASVTMLLPMLGAMSPCWCRRSFATRRSTIPSAKHLGIPHLTNEQGFPFQQIAPGGVLLCLIILIVWRHS